MYGILNMTYEDVMESDYIFMSNSVRKILEFDAAEFDDVYFNDSTILIMYNIANGIPLVLCERAMGYYEIDDKEIKYDGKDFFIHVDHSMRGSQDVTDIVLTRRSLYDAIMDQKNS